VHKTIKKIEPYIFIILCIINCIPVLQNQVFATMDGGAHIYNSTLFNELLFGDSELVRSYFKFNAEPVPNYTGSIILSFLNLFLPAFFAEKFLLLIYLIGLPLGFRFLIKIINPKNAIISYFIFPFAYTSVFVLGFYNYSIGIVFLLFVIGYWLKNHNNIPNPKTYISFFLLVGLVYFSHIFVFAILLLFLFFHFIVNIKYFGLKWEKIKPYCKKVLYIFLACFPYLLMLLYYFIVRIDHSVDVVNYLDIRALIDGLKTLNTLICYSGEAEEVYTKKLFYLIAVVAVVAFYIFISSVIDNKKSLKKYFYNNHAVLWLLLLFCMAFLYFKLPDSDGSGGFISVRISYFMFIFLLLFISSQKIKRWLLFMCVIGVLHFTHKLHKYYYKSISGLNTTVENCYQAAAFIEKNSLVLPINNSNNWLAGHFSNYLAADKPMVILENYEADKGYFPLLWNYDEMPNAKLKELETSELYCLYWKNNSMNETKTIDYVFVLGMLENNGECNETASNYIKENYRLTYKNNDCELYKLK